MKRLWLLGCLGWISACQPPEPRPTEATPLVLTLDSLYYYAKQTYLWQEALPAYETVAPRQYEDRGSALASSQALVWALSQLPINPATQLSYESPVYAGIPKYSFLEQTQAGGRIAAPADWGLSLELAVTGLYVSLVKPGSPAARAGLVRGQKVVAINQEPATYARWQQALGQSLGELTTESADGTRQTYSLRAQAYTPNPVLASQRIEWRGESLAYLALSDFPALATCQPALDEAFTGFARYQPRRLIIDLRYNSGGYVETAEYLANLMSASRLEGKRMYTERFNTRLQQGNAPLLARQLTTVNGKRIPLSQLDFSPAANTYVFHKKGHLESLEELYFIVSSRTASASELLINVLRPYYAVTLVGSRTFGKPVGFFGLSIGPYTVYLTNFQLLNARGEGEYFTGMIPDIVQADDVTHDFGDPREACLARVLTPHVRKSSPVGPLTFRSAPVWAAAPVLETRLKERRLP